jgi:hypothetical protein
MKKPVLLPNDKWTEQAETKSGLAADRKLALYKI